MLFWFSAVNFLVFAFSMVLYVLLVKHCWLRFLIRIFVISLVLGACTLYLVPPVNYLLMLLANVAGAGLLIAALIGLRFLASKLPDLFTLISITFVFLSIAFAWNFVAWKNHYLFIDRNPEHLIEYINHQDSKIWSEYLAHFPKEISPQCQDVSSFMGGMLDISVLQLRCKMSPAEVKNILDTYLPKAKYVEDGYDPAAVNRKAYWIHRFRNDSNNGFAPLPAHFKIMVFPVEPVAVAAEPMWQINYSCGIAVSTKTNEVIYWATHP